MTYDLSHLNLGPHHLGTEIQDDEALLLYALVRVCHMERILEIGGFNGYSARNFLAAMGPVGTMYSVDTGPVAHQDPHRHHSIRKDAIDLTAADVDNEPLDLIFFDCHVYEAQMTAFHTLNTARLIHEETIIALHDTGLFQEKFGDYTRVAGGWYHQPVERRMVNVLHEEHGYDALTLGSTRSAATPRKGITIMRRFKELAL